MALPSTNSSANTRSIFAFAVILLAMGLVITGIGINEYQTQTEALDNAVEVDATIVTSEVQLYEDEFERTGRSDRDRPRRTTDTPEYQIVIEFEYEFEGQQYRSSNVNVAGSIERFDSRSDAQEALAEYPEGTQTTAYVNPDEPGEAFLEDDLPLGTYLIPVVGGFLLFASVVLWGVFVFRIVSMPFKLMMLD